MPATVWDQNPRHIGVTVTVGAANVTPYIVGDVTISRSGDSVLPTCDFTLFTPRMAYYAAGSLSTAPQTVIVEVTCSAPGFAADTVEVFRGITEAPSNTGLYIPQGTIHAVGILSRTADNPGCLLSNAFPELTRVELLRAFAAGAYVPVTIDDALVTSGTVTKPQDLQGITVLDLLKRWGNIDGWEAREVNGEIQLVPFTEIAGAGATMLWAFTTDNYYSCAERPPSRPVTKWILSGNFTYLLPDPVPGTPTVTVTDVDGVKTTLTTLDGAIQELKIEVHEDYTPLGTTPQSLLTDTVVRRETTTYTYAVNGDGMPTAQLTNKVTVRESWYAPFSSVGTGGTDYTYTDGSFRHGQTEETLQETERITEAFTWDVLGDYLTDTTHERKAFRARPARTSDDGTLTETGTTWTARNSAVLLDAFEAYDVVDEITTKQKFIPAGDPVAYYKQGYGGSSYEPPTGNPWDKHDYRWRYSYYTRDTHGRVAERYETTWKENADGTRHTVRDVVWAMHLIAAGGVLYDAPSATGPGSSDTSAPVDGPVPWPESTCPNERQYSMVPAKATFEAIGYFDFREQSEDNEVFESAVEFERYARWRMKRGFADRITISHPMQPLEVMREWDPVTVTDLAREISAKDGWIEGIQFQLNPANGRADQQTVVALDPYVAWAFLCQ